MKPVALALSPHLDDAAFSCGGTLARLAEAGWRVVVATVFTRSVADPTGFALACQLDKGLGPEVDYMALRRREDAAAMAILGAEPRWLDLFEAPHRGYGSAAALFGALSSEDEIGPDLIRVLARVFDETRPDLILAPQAIGGHVDHVQVVRAVAALTPERSTMWWRDFPYVVREVGPKAPFGGIMNERAEATVALSDATAALKRDACLAYASQLGFQFGGSAGLESRLAEGGRFEMFRLSGDLPTGIDAHVRDPARA